MTASRSEYGLLKWLMSDIVKCDEFEFQLIVTGSHLSHSQGYTVTQIEEDGFKVSYRVDAKLDNASSTGIAETMGRINLGFAKAFEELKPDFVVVLGDRYELLPICSTSFVMRIPIIHISGGDVTEGAIDDGVRNAVTMLAEYHFPGTVDSAKNIIRMRGSDKNVWAVGEPGLDAFFREPLLDRKELTDNLGLDSGKKWCLMTYHPETKISVEENLENVKQCIDAILSFDEIQTVITYANADLGGQQINEYIEQVAEKYTDKIKVVPSLGRMRYLSFMRQADLVVGNSSSGIVEAPFLNIPVINIGDRQKGRYQCGNVYQCKANSREIRAAVESISVSQKKETADFDYWGDGHTSEKIVKILKKVIS